MAFKIMITVLFMSCCFSDSLSASRSIGATTSDLDNLASRLQLNVGAGYWDCWNALMEIRSCSSEIVSFFLNGKTNIGDSCCKSISIITHKCWPSMLASLGFTAAEGNVLSQFCSKGEVPSIAPGVAPASQS